MQDKDISFKSIEFNPFAGPEIDKAFPVIEPQAEIWASYLLGGEDANRSYNESISLQLEGPFDQQSLKRALTEIVHRHEALRAGFGVDGQQMVIFKENLHGYTYEDIADKIPSQQTTIIDDFLFKDAGTSFNLISGPLFRAHLFKLSETSHHLTLTAHHIVCDGWSMGVIMQELGQLYSSYVNNEAANLPDAPSFVDYAIIENRFYKTQEYKDIEQYWLDQYQGDIPVMDIPVDNPRPEVKSYNSRRDDYVLRPELTNSVKGLGAGAGTSFVTTMLVAFEVFLHRITGQDDIVLGIPSAGQAATENYNLVGHCVNMLPVRSHHSNEKRFIDFLKERKSGILDAYDHQRFTFGTLLQKLGIARDPSRVPLIPIVFNIDIGLDKGVSFEGITHKLSINKREFENFEIFLNASGSEDNLTFEWSYNKILFSSATIKRMMDDFESLLVAITADPEIRIGDIPMASSERVNREIDKWNNTQVDYPAEKPLHQLIERQALKHPHKVAFRFEKSSYTYKELNENANRLAALIASHGIETGDRIGLAIDRSAEMLISLLAILKSGAAYVPLDPAYPKKRIEYMLADSSAKLLIVNSKYKGRFESETKEIAIEEARELMPGHSPENPERNVKGSDLAYVMYTSGSAGKPKGTLIEHHSLVNFLYSMQKAPGITDSDRLLAVTTISFDIAGLELYLPLISGAELIIANADEVKDGRLLLDLIRSEEISIMQATPSTWKMMIDAGWVSPLEIKILCGGEALSVDLANKLLKNGRELWNMYGPTETTIWSAIKKIEAQNRPVTLGHPIDNTQIYILDPDLKPVMPGLSGEIYIAGAGLARGYLNKPELTSRAFIRNPFSDDEPAKIYRTGDLGKFDSKGEIIYLGRMDNQVKIRGHRVELNSIEDCLNIQDGIKEAVVVAREDQPGDQRLVAYVVPYNGLDSTKTPSWQERWEDLYQRGLKSDLAADSKEQQLDLAVVRQISGREDNDIRHEVEEWLEQSVKRTQALGARNIMEVGSGAGQLTFRLAPHAETFMATDYAQTAIDNLNRKLSENPTKWKNVKAFRAAANDFSKTEKKSLDLVIINSVAQYFPDAEYLVKVIGEAAKAVRDGGCIYIGDMQGKSTLTMHHAYDQLNRSDNEQTVSEFKKIVSRRINMEDELVADPEFFYLLPGTVPAIAAVDIQLRDGELLNETTKYHYDIWLYVNSGPDTVNSEIILEWDASKSLEWISQELDDNRGKVIELTGIYNTRTAPDHMLQKVLDEVNENMLVQEVKERVKTIKAGLNPALIWNLGNQAGYKTHVRWTTDGTDGLFDVVFIPANKDNVIPKPVKSVKTDADTIFDYARNPFTGNIKVSDNQIAAWKKQLGHILPAHMVPSEFVILKKMPLLPNGKTDRSALPKSEPSINKKAGVLPRTDVEKLVAGIWAEIFGLETVGVYEDFFELGGHSLIAVQVMIRLEKETGKRLPLATLFNHSTVESMALMLEMDAKSITWDSLVPIRPNGHKMPLYIVHGAGLNVLFFNTLVKNMDSEQPVFGLQAKGLNGIDEPLEKIEDMASYYISEILLQNPKGPYALAGFSFGGIIAFEMAKQLKAMGKDVKMLAMFDTYAQQSDRYDGLAKKLFNKVNYLAKQLLYTVTLFKEDPKRTLEYKTESIKRRFTQFYWKLRYGDNQKQEGFFGYSNQIDVKNNQAWEKYIFTPYNGSIELFRAQKRTFYMDDFEYLGWKPLALKGVRIHDIPGEHNFIFAPPNDREFARILQKCLDNAVL